MFLPSTTILVVVDPESMPMVTSCIPEFSPVRSTLCRLISFFHCAYSDSSLKIEGSPCCGFGDAAYRRASRTGKNPDPAALLRGSDAGPDRQKTRYQPGAG